MSNILKRSSRRVLQLVADVKSINQATLARMFFAVSAMHLGYCLYCVFHAEAGLSSGLAADRFPMLADTRLAVVLCSTALAAALAAVFYAGRADARKLLTALAAVVWCYAVYHRAFVYGRSALELTFALFAFCVLFKQIAGRRSDALIAYLLGIVMLSAGLEKANLGYLDEAAFRQYLVNLYSSTWPSLWTQFSESHVVFVWLTRMVLLTEVACGVLLMFQQRRLGGLLLMLIALGIVTTQILMFLPLMYLLLGLSIYVSASPRTRNATEDVVPPLAQNQKRSIRFRLRAEGLLPRVALGVALLFAILSTASSLFGLEFGTLRPITAIFPLGPYRMYTERVHDPFGYVVRSESGETLFDPRRREHVLASGLWVDINYRAHRDIMGSICFGDGEQPTDGAVLARIDQNSTRCNAYLADRWGAGDYEITVWDLVHSCEVKRVRVSVDETHDPADPTDGDRIAVEESTSRGRPRGKNSATVRAIPRVAQH